MTLTCGMVDLWVLHIDSLRRIFDQSLMKIFQRVQEIWSDKKVLRKDRRTDRRTDEGHFYNPHPFRGRGLINSRSFLTKIHLQLRFLLICVYPAGTQH